MHLKVCCIASKAEARLAIAHGASCVGLVSHMPSGPGVIDESLIREIADTLPAHVESWLLTSLHRADDIIAQHARCRPTTLQLVDAVEHLDTYRAVRAALPGVLLVQVIHVIDDTSLAEAIRVAPFVDRILLDSGNPRLAVKELGGTGRTHNWEISRRIRDAVGIPVFLAGGLTSGNVKAAIEAVAPAGIDVCSGVRADGQLSAGRLAPFAETVLAA